MQGFLSILMLIPWVRDRYWRYVLAQFPSLQNVPEDRRLDVFLRSCAVMNVGVRIKRRRSMLFMVLSIFIPLDVLYFLASDQFRLPVALFWGLAALHIFLPIIAVAARIAFVKHERINIAAAIALQSGRRLFDVCPACGYRIDSRSNDLVCPECGHSILIADHPPIDQMQELIGRTN